MSTSQALLGLLEAEPAHGYTLKQRYDECFPRARPLAFGQVYAALARFEKQRLAEVVGVESEGGPERRRYMITPEGVTVVDEWVSAAEPATTYSSSTLFAKVSVALMSGRDAEAMLTTQREVHLARMRELTRARRSAGPAELLAVTFELNHLDADLRWIEEAGRRLEELGTAVHGG
ncbi:MAG TPA: PadR family transcriptional regulator [Segeticoccus sp.]|nr:PadR family transcriptional regulator [Segeticoccus sp.]